MGEFLDSLTNNLLDIEEMTSPENVRKQISLAIKNEVLKGANPETLMHLFQYDQLKEALSYFNVKNRSKLTRSKDMSIALINEFGKGDAITYIGTSIDSRLKKAEEENRELKKENQILRFENEQLRKLLETKKEKKKKKKDKKNKTFIF